MDEGTVTGKEKRQVVKETDERAGVCKGERDARLNMFSSSVKRLCSVQKICEHEWASVLLTINPKREHCAAGLE